MKDAEHYLNYEGRKIFFSLPPEWRLISGEDRSPPRVVADVEVEVERALDNPLGSLPIEKIAKPGMEAVLLFDDQQRATPAHLTLPRVMNRLNRAGVTDDSISAICANGTHPAPTDEQLKAKVGPEALSRLRGRVFRHDARSPENIIIGRTHRGNIVEVNKRVALADLVIGIGACLAHPTSGYSGGYKIIMPGASSYRSVAEHHFAFLRHKDTSISTLDGNPFWEEIVDAGRLSRLAFKIDFVMNERGEVIRAFAGEPEAEQREAAKLVESLYAVELPGLADITVTSAFPLEIGVQSTKALAIATTCTKPGGVIVWVASQKQAGSILPLVEEMARPLTANEFHQAFVKGLIPEHLTVFGISYIMQIVKFKEFSERYRIIHVTEGLTDDQVKMMGMTPSADLQSTIDRLGQEIVSADVAVFPSGGSLIPRVRSTNSLT